MQKRSTNAKKVMPSVSILSHSFLDISSLPFLAGEATNFDMEDGQCSSHSRKVHSDDKLHVFQVTSNRHFVARYTAQIEMKRAKSHYWIPPLASCATLNFI